MDIFMAKFEADECQQCLNGGSKINMNGACFCVCPSGFKGDTCADKLLGLQTATTSKRGERQDTGKGFSWQPDRRPRHTAQH